VITYFPARFGIEDHVLPIVISNPSGPISNLQFDTNWAMYYARSGQDDGAAISFNLPHRWFLNSPITFRLQWFKGTSGAGTVKWRYRYAWAGNQQVLPDITAESWIDGSASFSDGDTERQLAVWSFPGISGTSVVGLSSFIHVQFYRASSGGGDTYAGDAYVCAAGFHMIQDWAEGSRQPYSK